MDEARGSSPQWVDAAQRLRQVREACLIFLDRWAVARLLADSPGVDRVMGDVETRLEAEIADHANRDWSILYRGSVLDD